MPQRTALYYIQRHETAEFGVIVKQQPGGALVTKGLAEIAPRRPFARETGVCLRLTEKGRKAIRRIEGGL